MNNWKETTLGQVAEIFTGKKDVNQTVPDGEYIFFSCSPETFRSNDYICDDKAIIIVGNGSYTGTVRFYEGKFDLYQRTYACTLKNDAQSNFDIKFLFYYVKRYFEHKFMGGTRGSSIPYIVRGDIENFEIPHPSLPEQKAIAGILSSFDDKIELLRRQNKTLESIAQTIFKESFVKDKIWAGNLSEYSKVQGGYAFKSEDFKQDGFAGIIKITNITMGVVDIHNTQFVDEGIVINIDEDKFRIKDGDFLIAMTGAEVGKIGIVEKTKKQIWLNQRVGKLVAKVPYGDIAGYLALRSREGQEHIVDAASGSAQANISSTGIEEMAFVPYSETDTNSFGEKVKPLFDKITFNLSQIQTLSRLRDALLPKLMKGEIKVKTTDKIAKETH